MDRGTYGDESGGVLRLDPRTKMTIFIVSAMMSLNVPSWKAMLLYAAMLCSILALSGKPISALKGILSFSVLLFLKMSVETSGESGSPFVSMIVMALASAVLFALPVFFSLMLLIETTRMSRFLSAFQAMHVPMKAVIPVAVLIRFIPTVGEEWTGIRKAMAFRGIETDIASVIRHPVRTVEHVLVPLLFSSVGVMEEMAAAAMARGMDAERRRTSWEEVRMRAVDWLVILSFLISTVLMVRAGSGAGVS